MILSYGFYHRTTSSSILRAYQNPRSGTETFLLMLAEHRSNIVLLLKHRAVRPMKTLWRVVARSTGLTSRKARYAASAVTGLYHCD